MIHNKNLTCFDCGSEYLHLEEVIVVNYTGDGDGTVNGVSISESKTKHLQINTLWGYEAADAIRAVARHRQLEASLVFWCENCHMRCHFDFAHHKGCTHTEKWVTKDEGPTAKAHKEHIK